VRFTIDSNVLVYALDRSARDKRFVAMQIVRQAPRADCILTFQSISEFYWTTARKRLAPAADAAAQAQDWMELFPCLPVTGSAIHAALADSQAGRAAYWDALLVATAAEAGCQVVLTEDLNDGAVLNSVRIHNPFTAGNGLTDLTRELLDL
jgi:predicted nucleic acid-binding protein